MKPMEGWPEESREAAQLVIDRYGDPDEATDSVLIWDEPGPWKRIVAYRDFDSHEFPAPHNDSVESFLQHTVPAEKVSDITAFDGSVVVNRTRGELSARCHDEEANHLALNLAHDIIEGKKTVQDARDYYAHEFLGYRRKEPTRYMEGLRFAPNGGRDPDERVLSDKQLEEAVEAGKAKEAQ
ncbi:MAG: hypothetical protein ACRDKA_05055 [Actinomycetota bacterium]